MKSRYYLEGLLGLLSVLGFVGVFTEERMFLAFFAFACNFQYFFIRADEMMTAYMNRSAARAFYADMFLTGAVTLGGILWADFAGSKLMPAIDVTRLPEYVGMEDKTNVLFIPQKLVSDGADIAPLVKSMNGALHGKGGGRGGFAQGSVRADEDAIRAFFESEGIAP